MTSPRLTRAITVAAAVLVTLTSSAPLLAQTADAPAPPPPPTAKAAAPIDLTGYWVSVIDTDWRWRMMVPEKGNYNRAAITPGAKEFADQWDPKKDAATGEQCRAYGAGGIMRMPGRLHITWQEPNTLRVDTDAGTQTRLLRFRAPAAPANLAPGWQGYSTASWEDLVQSLDPDTKQTDKFGTLHVVTTHMRLGYLLKNGLPYSANAVMTEDWNLMNEPGDAQWLVITTMLDDPQYLTEPRLTAPLFKREPDGSKWHPTPCSLK